jgi:hypothetical protein
MAKQTIITLIDDLDESVEADETVAFGLDGRGYEIDLSAEHADELRDALKPFVDAARRAGDSFGGGVGRRPAKPEPGGKDKLDKDEAAAIRAWVRENGGHISDRGRIPRKYVEAYRVDPKDTSIFDHGDGDDEDDEPQQQPETDELAEDQLIEHSEASDFEDDEDDEDEAQPVGAGSGVGDPFATFVEPESETVHF